jgi:hypothetical protein
MYIWLCVCVRIRIGPNIPKSRICTPHACVRPKYVTCSQPNDKLPYPSIYQHYQSKHRWTVHSDARLLPLCCCWCLITPFLHPLIFIAEVKRPLRGLQTPFARMEEFAWLAAGQFWRKQFGTLQELSWGLALHYRYKVLLTVSVTLASEWRF